jgi:hypothetical protein
MSTAVTVPAPARVPPRHRHALGLPAGSVRGLLALGVLGLLWGLALLYRDGMMPVEFVYLQTLMILILAHFFAAHGKSIGGAVDDRSPLGLPRGTLRFLLIVGYGGLAYFLYHNRSDFVMPEKTSFLIDLAILVTGFFLGHLIASSIRYVAGGQLPYWYQDVEAWLALMALIGLLVVAFAAMVNVNLPDELKLKTGFVQSCLAGIIGYYFGSRP